MNTCPVDRQPFTSIIVYNRIGGQEIAREKCARPRRGGQQNEAEEEIVFDDTVLCERCGCGDREEALLLCDGKIFQNIYTNLDFMTKFCILQVVIWAII